ncbi:MAG: peptidase M15, partial [Betaproteobacteria bacterium]|nr:peptidase M15 [Betaproteobacteria bacterium]
DINKFSNNVMAQQLFLTLSSAQGLGVGQAPPGEPAARGRFEASRQRVLAWWRQHLPDQTEPVLDNGSGLSRHERSSAQALSALLQVAAQSPYAGALQNSLSVAGVDGTLSRMQERSPHSAALGQAWLKSGSLRDVAALAGYVQGQSGQRYVFVAIVNHPQAALARPALDRLLEWTVQDKARH